jgi:hypothetical protein
MVSSHFPVHASEVQRARAEAQAARIAIMEKALLGLVLFLPTSLSVAFMLWVLWNLSQDGKRKFLLRATEARPNVSGHFAGRRGAEEFRSIRKETVRWGERPGTRFHVKTCD